MALDKDVRAFFEKTGNDYTKHELPVWAAREAQKRLPPVTAQSVVHDHAAGPGTATIALMAACAAAGTDPPKIYATDVSAGMIDAMRETVEKQGWTNVTMQVMDGKELRGFEDEFFTHSVTGLGVNMTGAQGIYRTLRTGGTAVATLFRKQPLLTLANEIRDELHPGLPSFPPGFPSEWWAEDFLLNRMKEGGFENVKIEVLRMTKDYGTVEDLVTECQNGFMLMARNGLTEDEKGRWDQTLRDVIKKRGSLVFEFEIGCAVAVKEAS